MVVHETKHPITAELLQHTDRTDPVCGSSRDRVLAADCPLPTAAKEQGARSKEQGAVRADITLEQVLDLVLAMVTTPGGHDYTQPMLQVALDGLRA